MKAEHRKELMTNTLAHRLGDAVQSIKEGPSRGTIVVLSAIGLIVIGILAWRYFSNLSEEKDSARWLRWDSLTTPEQLDAFVKSNDVQGHVQGQVGRIEEARRALHDGLRKLGSPPARKEAIDDLKHAADLYDDLVAQCGEKPLLHQQVLMGAAKAHESLGNIDQARDYYQQLRDKYGNSVLAKDAAEQLQRLDEADKSGELKALRDEFAPPPAPPPNPLPLGGKGQGEGAGR
jgi:tetratricopeptide (TPR) repeat protein